MFGFAAGFFWFGSAGGGVGLVAEVPGFRLVGWDGLAAASAGPAVGVDDLLPALAELVVVGVGGFGHGVLVPSGWLEQFTRGEAKALAAGLGARVVAVPSGKTTLVVQGKFDPASLRPGAKVGGKASKAMELAAKGQAIQIVDEVGFLDLVEGWV